MGRSYFVLIWEGCISLFREGCGRLRSTRVITWAGETSKITLIIGLGRNSLVAVNSVVKHPLEMFLIEVWSNMGAVGRKRVLRRGRVLTREEPSAGGKHPTSNRCVEWQRGGGADPSGRWGEQEREGQGERRILRVGQSVDVKKLFVGCGDHKSWNFSAPVRQR